MTAQIVSTGWYSVNAPVDYVTHGSSLIRSPEFRSVWWRSIDEFIKPDLVFVVDSKSPVKAENELFSNTPVKTIELDINPGHSQNTDKHYSGWMASVLIGLEFSLANDVDYFLYVEQDALIYGKNIINIVENVLKKHPCAFGKGLQQSFFAIRKDAIRKFISQIHRVPYGDRFVYPEMKFLAACQKYSLTSDLLGKLLAPSIGLAWQSRIFRLFSLFFENGNHFPFGYGRDRPIDFNDECFYFQHGSNFEIQQYIKKFI